MAPIVAYEIVQNKPRKKRTMPQDASEGLDTIANVKVNDKMIPVKEANIENFQINDILFRSWNFWTNFESKILVVSGFYFKGIKEEDKSYILEKMHEIYAINV